ncbi:DNA polymerase II large subunit [Candidatus Woesearchaeota archaeon]|mgnify:CR=1 FL=1|nr:DNA polymerase II large subunit [Candidatus Woesearchaeota archaeon]
MEMNEETKNYFDSIDHEVNIVLDLANRCRSKGLDPDNQVEIMLAKNMAERVVGIISVVAPELKGSGMVERIKELEAEYGMQDWRIALKIALETAQEKFVKFDEKVKAMEIGIRVGMAYITNGVVSSPLEGFTKLEIKRRRDGGEYLALFYSGPIRSAGGTASSVSLIIGDYIRQNMGYEPYDPDENEVRRMCTELTDYHERITNLQYFPSDEEITFLINKIPVQIDGDPSEKIEVSNYKRLDRIETDRIRNGVCLVTGEGIAQKAPKLWKQLSVWGKDFGLENWNFLKDFVDLQKNIKAKKAVKPKEGEEDKVKPDFTFIKDIVAGRPVFTHPMAQGGFRIRYGRTRVSGFSADSLHPATMAVLQDYIAIGTQLKVERPGKSTIISACDSIEGPIVKLEDGSVCKLDSVEKAKAVRDKITEILYLGDVLICYGDFFNRGHGLVPVGYCEEWWAQEVLEAADKQGKGYFEELLEKIKKDYFCKITLEEAINISETFGVALHPKYTYNFTAITIDELKEINEWVKSGSFLEEKVVLPYNGDGTTKRALELLGVPHKVVSNEYVVVFGTDSKLLKFYFDNLDFEKGSVLEALNKKFPIADKLGTSMGARMGRPEKAKMRKLTGSPHVLFPVGEEGGRLRSFQCAVDVGKVRNQFPIYSCPCGNESVYPTCEKCGKATKKKYLCKKCGMTEVQCHPEDIVEYKMWDLEIGKYYDSAVKLSGISRSMLPELVKGVRGTSNKNHVPENLVKGLLRAKHKIYVNKDGTTRYDMTEMPLTHFKAKEIGTSVEQLKKLGYMKDTFGNDLVDEDQVLELKIQDIIMPAPQGTPEEGSDGVFVRVSKFIDELLEKVYGEKGYYNVKTKSDLVGQLVLALAPHISSGAVGRIIGFSDTQGILAHPYFHSMVRRDCDGDELCCIMLADAMINFSRQYLPAHRGSTQDAPLVLTSILTPAEVDDMVFDMDIAWEYPLELYRAAQKCGKPWDVKVKQLGSTLGTEKQYYGMGYTHKVSDLNAAVNCSAYKTLPTMDEKVQGQMVVAQQVRAVKTDDVARLVIERHFIRDIKGNLRKFSMQQFRCIKCNEKYRRPPIAGHCTHGKCFGKIVFTISQGSIVKYLEPSLKLAQQFKISPYLQETLDITKMRVESIFGKTEDKQEGLVKFFS